MKIILRLILFIALLSISGKELYSQTLDEMRTQADALFEKGNFVAATPLYSKILAQTPRDPDINFRYGTCLLFNSHNKEEAIRYLAFAVKAPGVDKRAYFYMGRAYHLNYQFNEAILQYEKFKQVASPSQLKEFEVDQQILGCKNGKKLLGNVTDMIVIQKTEINAESFYQLYKLNNIGGTILVTDEFQTKLDKQKGHRPVIHFPANSPAIYYSSYGDDGSTGLDIYVKRKLPDGKYSQSQKVPGGVNTNFDEDYAYMHPDGKYLYFCSKGHNSMGGYDVFRCAYNESTQSFGPAENLDFAISSPDDDILFVVDSLDRIAYFSSARESQDGKIFVYQVRVERIPMQMAVIKGNFVNTVTPSNKAVSVRIEDFSTGRVIGTYNSKELNGDYLLTFPKSGKYKFFISVKGSDEEHYAIVDIPYSKEFKPLKQRITLGREDNGEQYVKIENLFNEEFDDPVAVMAEIYKELSGLLPNSTKYNLDSLDEMNKNNDVFVDAGLDPFVTKDDVDKVIADEIADLKNGIAVDQKNAAIAYNLAEEKSDLANAKMVEINKLVAQAENETDPETKKQILQQVYEKKKEVELLNTEANQLIALGNEIDKSIAIKETRINAGIKAQNEIKAIAPGDKVALGTVIENNKEFFVENVKINVPIENVVDNIIKTNSSNATKTQLINTDIVTTKKEISDLEKKNVSLTSQLNATNNKKEKAVIQEQIDENTARIEDLKVSVANKQVAYNEAIKMGDNSTLGEAATIVNNPNNATSENIKPLTNEEKTNITNKVNTNNLDDNIAMVNKMLDENNVGGPPINLFGSDETTKKYSLQNWTDEIDKEIKRLQTQQLGASPEQKKKYKKK